MNGPVDLEEQSNTIVMVTFVVLSSFHSNY